jgi:hypothetical protein
LLPVGPKSQGNTDSVAATDQQVQDELPEMPLALRSVTLGLGIE